MQIVTQYCDEQLKIRTYISAGWSTATAA